jgi:adenylate kinase
MLIERGAGKRVDPKTGEIYHTTFDWPNENTVQQRLVIPAQNTEQDIVDRLITYKRHIDGVLDTLKATSKTINVDQPKGDVFNQILEFVSRASRFNMPITPRIVLVGPAGSGKRTQATALAKKYDIVHVSMSALIKEAVALESSVGVAISPYVQKRQRIPDTLLFPLVKERLSKLDCVSRGWVLHGFPRTTDQAESLASNGFSPNRVFFLDIPNDSIIERVTLKYLDPVTGERYHMLFNPPPTQEIRDRLIQKSNDTEPSLRNKINEFYATIRELVDHYDDIGIHVNADQDPNTVFESIESGTVNPIAKSSEFLGSQ